MSGCSSRPVEAFTTKDSKCLGLQNVRTRFGFEGTASSVLSNLCWNFSTSCGLRDLNVDFRIVSTTRGYSDGCAGAFSCDTKIAIQSPLNRWSYLCWFGWSIQSWQRCVRRCQLAPVALVQLRQPCWKHVDCVVYTWQKTHPSDSTRYMGSMNCYSRLTWRHLQRRTPSVVSEKRALCMET